MSTPETQTADQELLELIAEHQMYPERLAMILWEWGEGELAGIERPDEWQMEYFREIGEEMRSRNFNGIDSVRKILKARGSGRGIGKSAEVGMIVVILLAAWPDAKITVMANSGNQLDTKTWPEISKWMRRSLVSHWFEVNTSIMYRKGARDSWFAVSLTWNLENPQASAGQQNAGSVNVFIFDEASEIPDKIFEIALSGMTTGLPIALLFGNPTMATGVFSSALAGKYAFGHWDGKSIDARTCRFPNKDEIDEAIAEYGIDSDYVRVWILGLPPKSNAGQYFNEALIAACQAALPRGTLFDALVAAVDLSWGGADPNTVGFRHGLDAWSIPWLQIPGEETSRPERMIGVLAEVLTKKYPTAVGLRQVAMLFMDNSGIASQVSLGLRNLGFSHRVCEVNFGGHAANSAADKNVRAEMMRKTKELMQKGLGIGKVKELAEDMRFTQPVNYVPLQFMKKELIRKELAKVRNDGRTSTDRLDTLAMTTYMPVVSESVREERERRKREKHGDRRKLASAWS